MSLTGNLETNNLGGFGGFPGFGFGGIAPVGLVGLNNLFDRGHHHGCHGDDDCATKMILLNGISEMKDAEKDSTLATLQAISSAKDDGRNNAIGLAAAIDRFKDNATEKFFDMSKDICDTRHDIEKDICDAKTVLATAITETRVDLLKSQYETEKAITALSVKTDAQFAETKAEQFRQTAVILAKLNETEIQNLRDELHRSHRRSDAQDIEIKINNSNTQTQAQFQAQNNALFNALDKISGQVARAENGILNIGNGTVLAAQTATPTNTNVH